MKQKGRWILIIMMLLLTACTNKEVKKEGVYRDDVKVADLVASVKEAYGDDYIPNVEYTKEQIATILGVETEWYEEAIAQVPRMSANVDTFVVIKAKPEYVENVKSALKTYRESLVKDTMQYPMNQLKIQASRVDSFGDYVTYTMLGAVPNDIEEQGDDAVLEKAEELNQKAIDVIKKQLKK